MNMKNKDTQFKDKKNEFNFKVKDPGSAITHFIAFVASIIFTPILLIHISQKGASIKSMVGMTIFMLSMTLLYAASSAYHTFNISYKANKILKKFDHMMIFILIAGSYTPVCLMLPNNSGILLLVFVWFLAIAGNLLKAFWVTCPRWVSSVIYIAMGWSCLSALPKIVSTLSKPAFYWLLAGGIIYTIGGVIYSMKFTKLNMKFKNFGSHEIFHLFVMGGSLCHYILMFGHLQVI